MKKLIKTTALLLLTVLLAACANNSGEDSGSNSNPESDKYVPEVLLSEEDIAGLKSTVTSPELKGSLSDGNWKYQQLSYVDYEGWSLSEAYKENFFSDSTEEEKTKFESWYWRNNNGYKQYKIPLDIYTSQVYSFSKENENFTVSEGTKTITTIAVDSLAQKIQKKRNNGETTTVKTTDLTHTPCPVASSFDSTDFFWKTNSKKTKFYAENGSIKYYIIKQ